MPRSEAVLVTFLNTLIKYLVYMTEREELFILLMLLGGSVHH